MAIDQIGPNPHQPRRSFDPAGLEELAASIRRHGILQPLVLREVTGGYHLIAGERRWRAARIAGLRSVPAIVRRDVLDEQMLELALVENVQRADLDAIEKARGYRQLIETLNLTQDQVAERVGLKRATVANHLRLLELPEKVQEAVCQGLISMGHARALLGVAREARLLELVQRVAREGLSVRSLEQLVRDELDPAPRGGAPLSKRDQERPPWLIELEGRMRERLGAKVRITNQVGYKGQIVIDYGERDELDRLCELLAPRRLV